MLCLNCQNETSNPKFCCRSCGVSYNNKLNPKRKLSKKCKHCDVLIPSNRKCCDKHSKIRWSGRGDLTIADAIYKRHHRSSAYALIRTRARSIAKSNGLTSCNKCGYDKHVEIAHIKPISEFSDDTLISVVNDLSNLMPLCPNCHWEMDHL